MLFSDILARRKVISQKLWSLNSSKGKSWHVSQTSHSIRVDYWPRKRSNAPSSSNPLAEDEARHRKHAFASAASRDSYPTMTSSTDGGVARLRKGLATVTQPSTILSEWLIWACVCSAEISLRGRKYGWGLKKEKEGNGLIAISNVGAVLTETDFYLDVGQIIYSGFIKIITLTFGFIFEVFFISSNFNSQVSLKSSEATQPYSGSPRVFVFPYHSLSVKTLVLNTMVSIRAETFWRFNVFWRSLPSKCDENGFQKENLNGEMDMCSILLSILIMDTLWRWLERGFLPIPEAIGRTHQSAPQTVLFSTYLHISASVFNFGVTFWHNIYYILCQNLTYWKFFQTSFTCWITLLITTWKT